MSFHQARAGHVASRGGKAVLVISQFSHNLSVSLSNHYSAKNPKLTQVEHTCSHCCRCITWMLHGCTGARSGVVVLRIPYSGDPSPPFFRHRRLGNPRRLHSRADTLIRDSLCYDSRNWLALIIFMENQETAAVSLIGTVPRRI